MYVREQCVSICLSPVQVPSRVESLQAEALSPTSVQVSWDPPSQPNGPILGYRLLWTESPSAKEQVSNASKEHLHPSLYQSEIKCDAKENDIGERSPVCVCRVPMTLLRKIHPGVDCLHTRHAHEEEGFFHSLLTYN